MQNKCICFVGLDLVSFAAKPHGFCQFGLWSLSGWDRCYRWGRLAKGTWKEESRLARDLRPSHATDYQCLLAVFLTQAWPDQLEVILTDSPFWALPVSPVLYKCFTYFRAARWGGHYYLHFKLSALGNFSGHKASDQVQPSTSRACKPNHFLSLGPLSGSLLCTWKRTWYPVHQTLSFK